MIPVPLWAIAGGVSLVVGLGIGWKVRDNACDAATLRKELAISNARVASLEANTKRIAEALKADTVAFELDDKALQEIERKAHEVVAQISAGPCLTPADTNRLRDYFNQRGQTKPSGSTP